MERSSARNHRYARGVQARWKSETRGDISPGHGSCTWPGSSLRWPASLSSWCGIRRCAWCQPWGAHRHSRDRSLRAYLRSLPVPTSTSHWGSASDSWAWGSASPFCSPPGDAAGPWSRV